MTKQAMNYLLGQLEHLGYLVREDDPDDQRSKRVQLTDRRHALRRAIRATVADIETELEDQLGTTEYASSASCSSSSTPARSPRGGLSSRRRPRSAQRVG